MNLKCLSDFVLYQMKVTLLDTEREGTSCVIRYIET